ncbi:MAG TPA: histidine kinase [Intrasporangium sp.]|uniref:sensor histidine kinase n=1 Tax=Intrasporangium sp. TaxID=1925024 RepID=UPI002B46E38F|nr:histidine kinase [Intrasporangium sp.]HKX68303.1 histidine kinase [Intrasporangium sp.]
MSPPKRPRVPRLDPRLFDVLVAVGLFVVLVLSFPGPSTSGLRPADAGAWALAVGLSMPYAAHRRLPWVALVVALGSLVTWALLHYAPYPALGVFVLLFGITLHGTRRGSLVAFGATVATLAVSLALQPEGAVVLADWISSLLAACVAWLAADNLRQRRARWAALEERALLLEREREERERAAVSAERLRIARELHDVVAHSMSVIAVQAGVGSHVIDEDVASAKAALGTIETTSRDALTEMRRMLGVLRDGSEPADVQPVHGLADLPSLAAQMRRTGLGVTLDAPTAAQVPACVELTAYRVVQESLTNVLKHGGPVAHVRVGVDDELVTIEVTDEGGRPDRSGLGGGHGLAGMRERLSLYGGTFEAGPRLGGGFRVLASLPRDASAS